MFSGQQTEFKNMFSGLEKEVNIKIDVQEKLYSALQKELRYGVIAVIAGVTGGLILAIIKLLF
jgi:hypothetical protein